MPKEIYVYLLVLSAFVSISLFEVFVAVGVLWAVVDIVRYRKAEGRLKYPIFTYSFVSLFSTIIYAPKMVFKAVEEGLFQLLYFFSINAGRIFIKRLVFLLLSIGVFLTPLVFYNFFSTGETKPIWGGTFEVGQFYAMFAVISILVAVYFSRLQDKKRLYFFAVLAVLFVVILVLTHRRSPMVGFFVVSYLSLFVLYKNNLLKKGYFIVINVVLVVSVLGAYSYLSLTDYRFKTLNQVITGEKPVDFENLNKISSGRIRIGMDAVSIIKKDLQEGNWINLLIGHGVRSGYYLPHEFDRKKRPKYESVFLLSEFIEKGIIGLVAILAVFYLAFKTFLTAKIREPFDVVALGLFVPLLIHLVGSVFTFFWDALLPMYLLLFKVGEVYFRRNV